MLDTVHEALITPPGIGYRRAHVDARRGLWGSPDAGRGGRRDLVAPHGGVGVRAARLAVSVRTGAYPRGEGAGAGGRGASARGRTAPGGGGFPCPGGFAEVAARHLPEQAEGGLRGDEGGPARGEGRAFLPGGSGAAGNTPFASRRRVEQAQHDRVATHGGRPAAHGLAGVAGPDREAGRASLPSFARPGPCCRRRSMAARASSRRSHARGASAASSPAPSAMAAPGGPGSRSAPKSTTRPPMRACVPVAGSPAWRTASVPRPSSRSKSSPTHAGSSVPGGGAVASAHRRLWKCRRPRCRGCSPTRPTGSASGRASCSSTVPACALCTALPRGCAPKGLAVSPGTLANTLKRFVALFEPVAEAILAHQNEAALRHADETTWRV